MLFKEGATLHGCSKRVLTLVEWLDNYANSHGIVLQINRGAVTPEQNRLDGGAPNSLHIVTADEPADAVDYCFVGRNIFEFVSELWEAWKSQIGPWFGVTYFEVCRGMIDGNMRQHIHCGYRTNQALLSVTGVYKK